MTLEIVANAAVRLMLLAAIVWLVLRAFRVRNAHLEALVWRLTVLAGLALPALLHWRVAPSFTTPIETREIVAAIPGATIGMAPGSTATLTTIGASLYLLVTSVLLVRLIVALAVMWRISRVARPMPTPDDVRISERVRSPATFGTVVLLPPDAQEWSAEKLDAVLTHERAHVRTGDGLWSWLAQLHAALFWFSPFAWWIQRRLETLAETTSDDAVLIARHDPADYAALLLEFARHPNRRRVAMSVADSNVSRRIERLLARIPPATVLPRATRWTAFALLIPVAMLAAATPRAATPASSAANSAAESADAPRPEKPLATLTQPANPDDYYPAVAKSEHVSGFAVLDVDVDALGALVDVRVVKVEPADPRLGFADAAMQVARNTRYASPTRQPASIRFMVKFALEH
jgi:TonB family protein